MPIGDELRAAFGTGRITPQRLTIARAAATAPGAFTVDDLLARVGKADAGVGVATVYRAVSAMERSGWLERVGERDGSALYARCRAGEDHHHHLICTSCGRVEAAHCPLPDVSEPAPSGFVITHHDVTMYGLCPSCRAGSKV